MSALKSVTVYCSSSTALAKIYFDAGEELGHAIAKQGWTLVYGGNFVGLMGTIAKSARAAGGKVIGVSPQLMVDKGLSDPDCHEFIVTNGMRDRKAIMEERGDAFVALPGGLGTFEEIFEIIVGKQLNYHTKAIVFLNINGYYNPLLAMIEHGIDQKFIKPTTHDLYFAATNVGQAISYLKSYAPPPKLDKWFEKDPPTAAE